MKSIPKTKLVEGWYMGSKRSRYPVAYWNGKDFCTLCLKCDEFVVKFMNHWDDKTFACFEPVKLIVSDKASKEWRFKNFKANNFKANKEKPNDN